MAVTILGLQIEISIATLAEALIVLPILGYVFWGRPYRRRMILGYFTPDNIADYFAQFWAGSGRYGEITSKFREAKKDVNKQGIVDAGNRLSEAMFDLYNRRFGWRAYLVPLIVLSGIIWMEASIVDGFARFWLYKQAAADGIAVPAVQFSDVRQLPSTVVVGALAGSFLWVGLNLFSRVASLSLLPSDVNYYSLRMAVAPALGFAFSTVAGGINATVIVAFAVTLLPIGDVLTWLRSIAARSLNVTEISAESTDRLINLPGIDADLAARFQDQGITTIKQFADTDPVQLSMRSGLDFAFIISLVDGALAWSYLGKALPQLNKFGWTGISDIMDSTVSQPGALSLVAAALRFADAKRESDAATNKLAADSANVVLQSEAQRAKQALEDAGKCLDRIKFSAQNTRLIADIAAVADLHLTEVGLQNVCLRISSDTYSIFIRHLIRDIEPRVPTYGAASRGRLAGIIRAIGGFGSAVKTLTRAIGEA